jgi:hypothetical protein
MKTGVRTKGRYQVKRELGLVPHLYDTDSKSFLEGAWKNWPCSRDKTTRQIVGTQNETNRDVRGDIHFLTRRDTRYHVFPELPR